MDIKVALEFIVLVYALNFLWEVWHAYYLYTGYRGKSFREYSIPRYLKLISWVSFVDTLMLSGVFGVAALFFGNLYWFYNMNLEKYLYFFAATIGIAVWVEIRGVYLFKNWAYLPAMPKIFGLGLSPLLQLAMTGLAALLILS
ncbi:MAG: hypothetical protein Q7S28_01905 [bacterium]|nr:hypothetical protein [bacterium]